MLSLAPKTAASRRFHTMLCTSGCIWTWPFKQNPCVPHARVRVHENAVLNGGFMSRARRALLLVTKMIKHYFFQGFVWKVLLWMCQNVSCHLDRPLLIFLQGEAFENWQDWCSDGRSWRIWGSGGDSDILCTINYEIVLASHIYLYRYWMIDIILHGIESVEVSHQVVLSADPFLKDDKSKYARRWLDLLLSRFSGAWRSNLNDLDAFSPEEKHPKLHGILHNAATIDDWSSGNLWVFVFWQSFGWKDHSICWLLTTTFCKASSPGSGGILGMSWPRNVPWYPIQGLLELSVLNVLTLQPSAQFSLICNF